jgi:Family of unknown function (DUF6011)
MSTAHQIENPAEISRFVHAGDARFTLVSKQTGTRITYRVRFPRDKETGKVDRDAPLFVSFLSGPDNENSYSYLGYIRRDLYRHGGPKAKAGPDSTPAKAFDWFYRHLTQGRLHPLLEFWHEGRCARCGRTLTVPSSIASGFGPECISLGGF